MSIRNVKEFVDACESSQIFSFRKAPAGNATSNQNVFLDLSMSPGNPGPQYYASEPLVSKVMTKSLQGGINHGNNFSTGRRYLKNIVGWTGTTNMSNARFYLLDYLMYYPFVPETLLPVDLVQGDSLTRYTDGEGVMVMPVVLGAHNVANNTRVSITYTNSKGEENRTSGEIFLNNLGTVSSIASLSSPITTTAANSIFFPLQQGDTGVRSIQTVQANQDDDGLLALVLVKPLTMFAVGDFNAPIEINFVREKAQFIEIKSDAYLNFVAVTNNTLASQVFAGLIETVLI